MKKLYTLLSVLFLSGQMLAQTTNFNLSKYKLPELKRHSLETKYDLLNSGSISGSSGKNDYQSQFNGSASGNYHFYKNSPTVQREVGIGLGIRGNTSSGYIQDFYDKKTKSFNNAFDIMLENRKYISPQFFIETDFNLSNYYLYDSDITQTTLPGHTETRNNKSHNYSLLAEIPLKIGIGRIDEVGDARQAIYLLDELAKANRLKQIRSDEDIIKLASFISQLKNKRFFDSRIRNMTEIEAIDSFFFANQYTLKQDARYFTTLTDFWNYGNVIRQSGNRLSFAIYPGGYYGNSYSSANSNDVITTNKSNLRLYNLKSGVEFVREKPINLSWQNSLFINGYYGVTGGKIKPEENAPEYSGKIPYIQLGYKQNFGYQPNTRSYADMYYGINFAYLFDKTDVQKNIYGSKGSVFISNVGGSYNYYISPRLRLSASAGIDYNWSNQTNNAMHNFLYNSSFVDANKSAFNFIQNHDNHAKQSRFYYNILGTITYSIF